MLNYNCVVVSVDADTGKIEIPGKEIANCARAGFPIIVNCKYAEYGDALPDSETLGGDGEGLSLGYIRAWYYDDDNDVWVFVTEAGASFTCSDLSDYPTVAGD